MELIMVSSEGVLFRVGETLGKPEMSRGFKPIFTTAFFGSTCGRSWGLLCPSLDTMNQRAFSLCSDGTWNILELFRRPGGRR